jgi:hypothetical protein
MPNVNKGLTYYRNRSKRDQVVLQLARPLDHAVPHDKYMQDLKTAILT